jgi:hypothetical protein
VVPKGLNVGQHQLGGPEGDGELIPELARLGQNAQDMRRGALGGLGTKVGQGGQLHDSTGRRSRLWMTKFRRGRLQEAWISWEDIR